MAEEAGGRFLLRIEDIDLSRCTPQYEETIYRDLAWLGLCWEEPVRRQSFPPQERRSRVHDAIPAHTHRSEEHTSELQSLMRISYAVFCLKKKKKKPNKHQQM